MKKGPDIKSYSLPALLAVLYFAGLTAIANSFLNGLVYVPVIFGKINIPVAAWALTGLYSIAACYSKETEGKVTDIVFRAVALGCVAHQYLLFVRLFDMIFDTPIGRMYIGYIIAVFAVMTFLICLWGMRIVSDLGSRSPGKLSQAYFLPIVLLPLWPIVYFIYRKAYGMEIVSLLSAVLAFIVFKKCLFRPFPGFLRRIHSDKLKVAVILFIISFIFRFAFSANVVLKTEYASPRVQYVTASDDGPTYDTHGRLLAGDFRVLFKDGIITPGLFEPGYGIFLGFIYKIFGHNFFAVGFIQAILGSIVTLLCFSIALQFFDLKTAVISSYLIALNQSLIFIFGTLNAEVTYIFFIYLSLWLLVRAYRNNTGHRGRILFTGGLVFGLAVISRGVILLFPCFIFIWMAGKSQGLKEKFSQPFRCFGIFISGLLIVLIGMCCINYLNVGKFILTTKGDAYLRASSAEVKDYHFDEKISPGNTIFLKRGFDFSKPSAFAKKVVSRPLYFAKTYLEVVPTRIKNFFFWPEHGYFDPVMLYQDPNPFKETLAFYAVLLFFTGVGLSCCRFSADKFLILGLIFYYSMLHSTIGFVETVRYRIPVVPCILIITGYGIAWLLTNVLEEKNGS